MRITAALRPGRCAVGGCERSGRPGVSQGRSSLSPYVPRVRLPCQSLAANFCLSWQPSQTLTGGSPDPRQRPFGPGPTARIHWVMVSPCLSAGGVRSLGLPVPAVSLGRCRRGPGERRRPGTARIKGPMLRARDYRTHSRITSRLVPAAILLDAECALQVRPPGRELSRSSNSASPPRSRIATCDKAGRLYSFPHISHQRRTRL
jgi:hypothetical protein